MLVVFKIIFSLQVIRTLVAANQLITHRLAPTTNKPPVSGQIFSIHTPVSSQCIYVCVQNEMCLAVMYDIAESLCTGYQTPADGEPLGSTVKAWNVIYKG